jgi:hypothetical protein
MAKRTTSAAANRTLPSKDRTAKPPKGKSLPARSKPEMLTIELQAAHRRIRDLEELHRKVGQRLDAAIDTIHKILGHSA